MLRVRSSRPEPTRTIVELIGEVDMSTTCDLAAQLHTHLEESRRLVIDMSKLRFLSASGLNVLVAASNDARERGVPLSLKGGDVVQHVFEVAGLRAYFDFVDG
ncbi:STAS domain-containing protein [Lentzea xinjiangensis]|nr:STAS domain-containing protein [Lentzea xinjiangensis]